MVRTSKITICVVATSLLAATDARGQQGGSGVESQSEPLAFGLARRGTATVEDAYRLFLTMAVGHNRVKLKGPVSALGFDEVAAQLESMCVIDSAWCYAADSCLRRDVLAYMCASYMGCRPGLITSTFGMTRRYAHREMMYQRVIPSGPPGTFVTGSELLAVVTRVERRVEPKRDVQLTDDEIH
jgi:hypothetical protein